MSSLSIKPIETRYKGYRLRSRLEARWAVFFDSLGIRWEYEPQGIMAGNSPYLPDFFLPGFNQHFEVKPWYDDGFPSLEKCWAASEAGLDLTVLIGNPWPWEYFCFATRRGQKAECSGTR